MKNSPTFDAILHTRFAWIAVCMQGDALAHVHITGAKPNCGKQPEPAAREVMRQLVNYLKNPRYVFNLPLYQQGTAFQRQVWQTLCEIPSGEVRTYGELANLLGSGARAVGNACRANPVPLVVPCHRVVGVSGIGGFMGQRDQNTPALQYKSWLLQHEQMG